MNEYVADYVQNHLSDAAIEELNHLRKNVRQPETIDDYKNVLK